MEIFEKFDWSYYENDILGCTNGGGAGIIDVKHLQFNRFYELIEVTKCNLPVSVLEKRNFSIK